MPCYKPLPAYQDEEGQIQLADTGRANPIELACGKCVGCLETRARAWSIRCTHESKLHEISSFVTLTFDDKHIPDQLTYDEFRRFMRRLRAARKPEKIRFFMCGEYGSQNFRPHYHAILFGVGFADKTKIGKELWRSAELEQLWPQGFSSIGDVNDRSIRYVTGYVLKKKKENEREQHELVDQATGEITKAKREFTRMSLKPGIGHAWIKKFITDVFPRGHVILAGQTLAPPRYYDNYLKEQDPSMFEEIKYDRFVRATEAAAERTSERLAVRETVAKARLKQLQRKL